MEALPRDIDAATLLLAPALLQAFMFVPIPEIYERLPVELAGVCGIVVALPCLIYLQAESLLSGLTRRQRR